MGLRRFKASGFVFDVSERQLLLGMTVVATTRDSLVSSKTDCVLLLGDTRLAGAEQSDNAA